MTRRKKIIVTILVMVLVLPILAIATLGILATLFPSEKHTFTNELLLPMTPVKDQGNTEFCWAYAMLATIETEHILRGDSVNLSPQYLGRMLKKYQKQKVKTERGMGQTALNLLERYGVVGYDVMSDDATDKLPMSVHQMNILVLPASLIHLIIKRLTCPSQTTGNTIACSIFLLTPCANMLTRHCNTVIPSAMRVVLTLWLLLVWHMMRRINLIIL